MSRLVVALAGTDHHPFDRLVRWIDAAAVRHPDLHFIVQHGVTRAPSVAEGHDFLAHSRLVELLAEASVVACHGGPGTIMEARELGHVPLCVPRDPRLGEHVDDHQQRFARVVAAGGAVHLVTSERELEDELAATLLLAPDSAVKQTDGIREAARALVAAELDEVVARIRPQVRGRWHAHS